MISRSKVTLLSEGEGINVGSQTDANHRGAFQANGPTFVSQQGEESWYGIRFNNYSDDATSSILNSTIELAEYGIQCIDSSPLIANNTLTNKQ